MAHLFRSSEEHDEMKELMMNEDFSDVTLVTEDKKQIKANINIQRMNYSKSPQGLHLF